MKNKKSLVVSISTKSDIDKIKENTKYINIDITKCDHDVITYFMDNGWTYMFSENIDGILGYIYVSHDEFFKAESIINMIYANMPDNLNKLEIARYLYVSLAKYVFFDINIVPEKNEDYNLSLISNVNNLWGSLALGRINDISISKLYYYLCRRMDIDITLEANYETKEASNKLKIDNMVLNVDLFQDIPYLQVKMKTKYFGTYNDEIDLDKKVKYIKNKYNDDLIDASLKNIDYTEPNVISEVLYKTQNILNIDLIKPVELSIIYNYIFSKYCPNYDIKISNLYLNNILKDHFIMISYNDCHYSYNYKKKTFIKVEDNDIIDSIQTKKIGLYLNEFIPNININLNYQN